MRHTIVVWVANEFGVLTRVAGLFSGRGYNIESLSVAPTEDDAVSRITLVTSGDDRTIDQILKSLRKLIAVRDIVDLTETRHVDRELVLVKVRAEDSARAEILRLCEIFRGHIVDTTLDAFVVEITGNAEKIGTFLDLLQPLGVLEIARSGAVAMARSPKVAEGGATGAGKVARTRKARAAKADKA